MIKVHTHHINKTAPVRCGDYCTELCKLKYITYENVGRKLYLAAQVIYDHGIVVVVVYYKIGKWLNIGIGINIQLVSNDLRKACRTSSWNH